MTSQENSSYRELKEQLSEKELRSYELELQVKDLQAVVKDFSDIEEKLKVANRNARVLEEENNSINLQLKKNLSECDVGSSVSHGSEALKLIKENTDLRSKLKEFSDTVDQLRRANRTQDTECSRQIRNITEDCERMRKETERKTRELENMRHQCVELHRKLEDMQETVKASNELLHQERDRYTQKIDELLANSKRTERLSLVKDSRLNRDKAGDEPLQQVLLKEEVAELEKKLKDTNERLWAKEKELLNVTTDFKRQIENLSNSSPNTATGDNEVLRALRGQITSLKQEISSLRGERRPSRPFLSNHMSDTDASFNVEDSTRSVTIPQSPTVVERTNTQLMRQYRAAAEENDALRDTIIQLKDKIRTLEGISERQNVHCQELEVLVATAKKDTRNSLAVESRRPQRTLLNETHGGGDAASDSSRVRRQNQSEEMALLKRKVRDLQNELNTLKAAGEQKNAIVSVRLRDCQDQVDELLRENGQLRREVSRTNDRQYTARDGMLVNDFGNCDYLSYVTQLSKDKRDSVEDVMRMLEAAWLSDEDSKCLVKKANFQGAALANYDAMKDEEIRRLQQALDVCENEQRASGADRASLNKLKEQLIQRDNIISDLENDIKTLEKRVRDLEDDLRNVEVDREEFQIQSSRDHGEKQRLENERVALYQKLKELEDAAESAATEGRHKNEKLDALRRQLNTARDDNDRLRQQYASLRNSPGRGRPVSGRSVTPRTSARSPKLSTRRRSVETTSLSQLSIRSSEERKRSAVPEGAHLAVTVVELCDVLRKGRPVTEPGYIIIKLKSIKEKYKTTVKELSSVIRFDETFVFYLAQPDQDVITLHVFYKPKSSSREYHIGDACFSMATLCRGVPRQRIAPVVQNPGAKDAQRAGQIEVNLQTDDFGKMLIPTAAEIEDETFRFNELTSKFEATSPEKLHAVDVYLASSELH